MVMIFVFVAFWLGLPFLVLGALWHSVLPGGWLLPAVASVLIGIVPPVVFARGLMGGEAPSAAVRLGVLRPFWYALLFLPLLGISGVLGVLAGWPWGAAVGLGRWATIGAACGLLLAALLGWFGARRLVVREVEARLPSLPDAFTGLRIVQISDLHVGSHTSRCFLARVAEAVREAEPDLIVVTGDQVDDFGSDVELFNAAFADLEAPLGIHVVAGNHDVYAGWEAVERGLLDAGFSVLVNEAVAIEREGQRLWLAGTGDPAARARIRGKVSRVAPDIERTLRRIPPGETALALAHNPALWPALAERGVALTLSGHTHYGQLAFPRWHWCAASPFLAQAMGAYRQGDSLLYINPGTNFWGIPFRLGTPPEVTVLTLRHPETGESASIGVPHLRQGA